MRFGPVGHPEQQARIRTEKLLQKIYRGDNKITREATFRLQHLFAEQGLSLGLKSRMQIFRVTGHFEARADNVGACLFDTKFRV